MNLTGVVVFRQLVKKYSNIYYQTTLQVNPTCLEQHKFFFEQLPQCMNRYNDWVKRYQRKSVLWNYLFAFNTTYWPALVEECMLIATDPQV